MKGVPATFRDVFQPRDPRYPSLRRDGQLLVVVGAVLGALVGVILGLAVGDGRTGAPAVAPTRARGAAVAAAPPTSQLTVPPPADSGDRVEGHGSTGRLRVQSVDHPRKAKSKADKDSKPTRKAKDKGSGDHTHAASKPDKGKTNS